MRRGGEGWTREKCTLEARVKEAISIQVSALKINKTNDTNTNIAYRLGDKSSDAFRSEEVAMETLMFVLSNRTPLLGDADRAFGIHASQPYQNIQVLKDP